MRILGRSHDRQERREQRIKAQVTEAAMLGAIAIQDSIANDEIGPYRVPLGRVPRGISASEYAEQLGGAVEIMLDAMGCETVEMDRAITDYTSRAKQRRPFMPNYHADMNGPRVMFRQTS